MHMTEANDRRAENRSKNMKLYHRKGWKGFVWGYKDWIKATEEEGRWDKVDWGKDGKKSGAKEIHKEGNTTVYRY